MHGKPNEFKKRLEPFGLRLGTPISREAGQLVRPIKSSSICLGSEQVFLLGEAAGLISPSSAEGISGALSSAFYLAKAFGAKGSILKAYRRHLCWLRWQLWAKTLKSPAMFHPQLRKFVMLSSLTALEK
jgi:flavin-dependent dehydrogenase